MVPAPSINLKMESLELDRLAVITNLFTGAPQHEVFDRIKKIFPTAPMPAALKSFQFPLGSPVDLPESYVFDNMRRKTADLLVETDTSALLVLEDGKLRFERYWLTGEQDVQWMSMSVAKSFISALVGIAIDEGHIRSVEDAVSDYVQELKGSAYDGVRIKDVLQMSSGANWTEVYGDPDSSISQIGAVIATGGALNAFASSLARARDPGTYRLYNSADTQVLGMLLLNATGRAVHDYMTEKLWHPLGMEFDGYWVIDDTNMEMTFGGLNATARDFAKLGELYRNNGRWNGQQIVSADWVRQSVTPDAPHLQPGSLPSSDSIMGYGYQWWIPPGDNGEFSAIGVYNQFVYVHPTRNVVICKLSANRSYSQSNDREAEHVALFRSIVQGLRQ
jgi:CubicO group peptidase (beta-lactamase class C family)